MMKRLRELSACRGVARVTQVWLRLLQQAFAQPSPIGIHLRHLKELRLRCRRRGKPVARIASTRWVAWQVWQTTAAPAWREWPNSCWPADVVWQLRQRAAFSGDVA